MMCGIFLKLLNKGKEKLNFKKKI